MNERLTIKTVTSWNSGVELELDFNFKASLGFQRKHEVQITVDELKEDGAYIQFLLTKEQLEEAHKYIKEMLDAVKMSPICPFCAGTSVICPECETIVKHGKASHCDNYSCQQVGAVFDCLGCGRTISKELDGVIDFDMSFRKYRKEFKMNLVTIIYELLSILESYEGESSYTDDVKAFMKDFQEADKNMFSVARLINLLSQERVDKLLYSDLWSIDDITETLDTENVDWLIKNQAKLFGLMLKKFDSEVGINKDFIFDCVVEVVNENVALKQQEIKDIKKVLGG